MNKHRLLLLQIHWIQVAESSDSVEHRGSQETKRDTGGQDKQRATEGKETKIVRAHQSGL